MAHLPDSATDDEVIALVDAWATSREREDDRAGGAGASASQVPVGVGGSCCRYAQAAWSSVSVQFAV